MGYHNNEDYDDDDDENKLVTDSYTARANIPCFEGPI